MMKNRASADVYSDKMIEFARNHYEIDYGDGYIRNLVKLSTGSSLLDTLLRAQFSLSNLSGTPDRETYRNIFSVISQAVFVVDGLAVENQAEVKDALQFAASEVVKVMLEGKTDEVTIANIAEGLDAGIELIRIADQNNRALLARMIEESNTQGHFVDSKQKVELERLALGDYYDITLERGRRNQAIFKEGGETYSITLQSLISH